GVAISPGRQKISSNAITGSPLISPMRLARVDLPDAPRPMMTTRLMVFSYADWSLMWRWRDLRQSCCAEDLAHTVELRRTRLAARGRTNRIQSFSRDRLNKCSGKAP